MEIVRGKCRIGVDMPADVVVLREELLPEKDRYENTVRNDGRVKGVDGHQTKAEATDPEFGVFIDRIDTP